MRRILIISGPTASGKTALALKLAEEFDGELISADSRQVYREMDIVTGKDLSAGAEFKKHSLKIGDEYHVGYYEINNIRVWGLDIVMPNQSFDVSAFILYAQAVIHNVWKRGKLPIIVGGTGFYIHSLLKNPETVGIPLDNKLRAKLEKFNLDQLQRMLQELDFDRWGKMNNSDRNNPRRLTRAIEVAKAKKEREMFDDKKRELCLPISKICWIGIRIDKETLAQKIKDRVMKRMQMGALNETIELVEKYGQDIPALSSIGYRDLKSYIDKQQSVDQTIKNWILHETQYAKRQMTWFAKEKEIKWFDVQEDTIFDRIREIVQINLLSTHE